MTVGELIEELKTFPQDMTVQYYDAGDDRNDSEYSTPCPLIAINYMTGERIVRL